MGNRTMIRLAGIEATGRHGVLPEEKENPQRFVVDIECVVVREDVRDDVATTTDYRMLAQCAARAVAEQSFDLIETLAQHIAEECLGEDERLMWIKVSVHKPEVVLSAPVADVCVTVSAGRVERW